MNGYTTDEKTMFIQMNNYQGRYIPHIIETSRLRARMPNGEIIELWETPHYKYMMGDKQPYIDFRKEQF